METTVQDKPGLASRVSGFLRDPLRPLLRFLVRRIERMEEAKALRLITRLRGFVAIFQRRRRRTNLALLGDPLGWTPAQKEEIEKQHLKYLARMDLHLIRLPKVTPAEFFASVQVRGEENIAAAVSGGRGVLLITAHAGTWWHIPAWAAGRGHPVRVSVNPGLPPSLESLLHAVARRFNIRVSYIGQGAYTAARESFQRGEVFMTAVDLSFRGERSLWLPFGPVLIAMDPGPAILALRQRVPVVWASSYHDAAGRSCLEYFPPVYSGPGTGRTTPEAVLRDWLELMYAQWHRHPEQWWPLSFCSLRAGPALKSQPQSERP